MSDSDETVGGRTRMLTVDTYAALSELSETWSALAMERAGELDAAWASNAALGNDLWMARMERDRNEDRLAAARAAIVIKDKKIADLTEALRRRGLTIDSMVRALTRSEEHIQKLEELHPANESVEIVLPAVGRTSPLADD